MNILVVNDDGYNSERIIFLAETLKEFGNVTVIAPLTQRSAMAHASFASDGIRAIEIKDYCVPDVFCYAITGTPVDCINFALHKFRNKFDLVVSGINDCSNKSAEIYYSATVGAALEACTFNIPAIAISAPRNHYELCKKELYTLLKKLFKSGIISKDYLLNINFPRTDELKGIKFTIQGKREFYPNFLLNDNTLFFEPGDLFVHKNNSKDYLTDLEAMNSGYISITPLIIDKTDYQALKFLEAKSLK